ncbi:MAG: PQQ-dependent sugar dehydrogenase [Planctomycetota bacterium]
MRFSYAITLLAILTSNLATSALADRPKKVTGVATPVVAFPNLKFDRPIVFAAPPDGTDRAVVVEQQGRVWLFPNRTDVTRDDLTLTLDLTVRRKHNEEGLLGLAFHPDFYDNGQVFLYYSMGADPDHPNLGRRQLRSIVSRFTFNEDRNTIAPGSEIVLLDIPQPYGNHNGGHLAFGEDGYLYVGVGDGGSAGDPKNKAQDLTNLLGSILRIDVDRQADARPYAIPDDNPFIDEQAFPGARPEIYALGLRNPWRFSFDRRRHGGTGQLWAADVGQQKHEEINLIRKGGNYGWRVREGFKPFNDRDALRPDDQLLNPLVDHERRDAGCITGGHVYRGQANPLLQGAYVYGDYLTNKIFLLRTDSGQVRQHQHFADLKDPVAFGLDRHRELHVCSFNGRIYRFVPTR